MKKMKDPWPGSKAPGKPEIERMYRMAYTVDPSIFRIQDVVDFGIDLHRLKEFGQVEMKKDAAQLRKQVRSLWDRMDPHQKAAFILGDFASSLVQAAGVLQELEKVIGSIPDAHEGLEMARNSVYAKIPRVLQDRLDHGFGKWKSNGST